MSTTVIIATYLLLVSTNMASILWAWTERCEREDEQSRRRIAEAALKRQREDWP